ncbi:hypothetical protein Nepgr_020181 [Nepenthes gracilis]|uniref:65-kDa microtubule-associated protein 3 n=1 Tax=Nepenthes gracilis TaxID=150966 RepID=A0AAD3SWE3_NEPGR|nr:hypothetical protein Nepgr_020181 [Nepenthes gracilis]
MLNIQNDPHLQVETTCGSLLYELQIIWDEVGESETDRDKMLLQLEQECLELYRKKVDQANRCRAQLRQTIADSEAELASICSTMGERPLNSRQSKQKAGSLKEELRIILMQLEQMQMRKLERKKQFSEILEQIQKVSTEIRGSTGYNLTKEVDETDLSTRKLAELQLQLQALQNEKSDRLKQVMQLLNNLKSLCSVLGLDFKQTVNEIHPNFAGSEETYSISDDTLQSLESSIKRLRGLKVQKMQRLQDLSTTMLELWNLMDSPVEEQQPFQHVTCNVAASEDELNTPGMLSSDFIKNVEAEVSRLEHLKSSKMKELVLKKRSELEEMCRRLHLVPETDSEIEYLTEAIESGALDPSSLLEQVELEIAKIKEESFSRKEILDRVEKWLYACEEESWLEEYNMDENRYNAGRGAHLILKRAEKARALVNKLPGMVTALVAKATAWENERGIEFMYDGIPLLSMVEEYTLLCQEKEHERIRQREQKKLQGQLMTEQEALFGSKPSPLKLQSGKKTSRMSNGSGINRRQSSSSSSSVGGTMLQTQRPDSVQSARATPYSGPKKKGDQNDDLDDDSGAPSSNVRKGLDLADILVRANSFNGHEAESHIIRRPFSPVFSQRSPRVNIENSIENQNRSYKDVPEKKIFLKNDLSPKTTAPIEPTITLLKATTDVDEENMTPKVVPIPPPLTTPSTVSRPMETAMTPALPLRGGINGGDLEEEIEEEVEYSFEEKRAGFVVPNTNAKRYL